MITCQHFHWIHVMKTGGHWIRYGLLPHFPEAWQAEHVYRHVPLSEVREQFGDRPSWAVIRNPWHWYLSMHTFMFQHWWDKTGSFSLPPCQRPKHAQAWAERFELGDRFEQTLPAMLAGELHWPLSEHFAAMTRDGDREVDHVLRFETLREDVGRLLRELCGQLPPELEQAIQSAPPSNTSRHGSVRGYYTSRLIELVAEADQGLIERFGYSPPV